MDLSDGAMWNKLQEQFVKRYGVDLCSVDDLTEFMENNGRKPDSSIKSPKIKSEDKKIKSGNKSTILKLRS